MMGMQCLSGHVFHIRVIQVISDQWESPGISYGCGSDGSGRSQASDETRLCPLASLIKSVMGDGFLTVFKIYRALDDGALFSGKRGADGSGRRCDTALYYGKIFAVHFAVLGHGRKDASADQGVWRPQ